MNPEQDQFEKLQKLLTLKRGEQPPPGYFDDLPNRILLRVFPIQRRELLPWWQRLMGVFDPRPVVLGAFGTAVCGLMMIGFSLNEWRLSQAPAEWASDSYLLYNCVNPTVPLQAGIGISPRLRGIAIANSSTTPLVTEYPNNPWLEGQAFRAQRVSFVIPFH
ncbi:MAG TPA: hypothetical protein P5186_25105 [Candidatus Paceibacterota bacterium]|nr:hypothetical protein [Verrucomicrobiota bacterium]HRY51342.1 hypothetical protein [Candidatus Paceibacterota bacterium]HSA02039.1 hypothetical protein [Candidatus Paceibacterota bacterium]